MNTMSRLMSAAREMRTAQTVEEKPRLDSAHHRNKWLRRFYTGYVTTPNSLLAREHHRYRGNHVPHQGIQECARRVRQMEG